VVSAAVLLLVTLVRLSPSRDLTSRAAFAVYLAMGISALFWASFSYWHWKPPPSTGLARLPLSFLFPLMSFPDVVDQVLRPWGSAVPALGAGLVVLLGVAIVQVLRTDEPSVSAPRALLVLLLTLLLITCAGDAPRHETRYVFFLYPLAIVLALGAVATAVARFTTAGGNGRLVTAFAALGLFVLSEDFQPRHLLTIVEPSTIFRRGLTPGQQSHLVARDDTRAIAGWLESQAGQGAAIISAVQSLDYYEPRVEYFYVDRTDFNFESYTCRYGTLDRWSNKALLQRTQDIEAVIAARPSTYLVAYSSRLAPLLGALDRYRPRVSLTLDHVSVVAFSGGPKGASYAR
jgi:hypothetical protein